MTRTQILSGFLVIVVFMVAPTLVFGAGLVPIVPSECNGTGGCASVCDIAQVAQNILNDGIYIAVFLTAVLFAWAGLKMLVSVANPGERSRAKTIFANVAIGFVIILAGWLVVDVLMRTLVGGSVLPWNKVCVLFMHGVGLA